MNEFKEKYKQKYWKQKIININPKVNQIYKTLNRMMNRFL